MRSIANLACMFVYNNYYDCFAVRIRMSKFHQISPNFLYMLPVAVAPLFSDGKLCTSGLVDDVMFSRNGANWLESETTRIDGGTWWAKAAVSYCVLLQLLICCNFDTMSRP